MEQYMSIPEAALRWNMLPGILRNKCETKQIAGAVRFGYRWLIPVNALCPA